MTPLDPPRRHVRRTVVLAVAGVLAVAVHLGLGGLALANPGWTRGAADIVLAIVVGKVLLIVVAASPSVAARPRAEPRKVRVHRIHRSPDRSLFRSRPSGSIG
jgi:hypothetical protein